MEAAFETAYGLIERVQKTLDKSLSTIKQRCLSSIEKSSNEDTPKKISTKKLDEHQLASYDLAYCEAELTAARTMLDYCNRLRENNSCSEQLEEHLTMTFIAEAFSNIRSRLSTHYFDFGLTKEDLAESVDHSDIDTLCQRFLSSQSLTELGQCLLQRDGHTGEYALDEEKTMMQESFREFAKEVIAPRAEEIHRQDLDIPDEILQPLNELGCFGLSIPEQYEGLQPNDKEDNLGMIVVTEELSRGSVGAGGSLITRPEIMARTLLKGGTEEQKDYWLPKIAKADPLCAIAVTEPNYGSDVANMRLKATRTEGGWLLNGEKTWCTFGGKAGVLLTLARTDPDLSKGHKGLTMFMVEKPSTAGHAFEYQQPNGGKLTGRAIPTMGYRGMHSFTVFYDDVFVPDSHVVGEENGVGKGFYYTMAGFAGGRIQTAARATGLMQAAYDQALLYAQDRKVFEKPIAEYPLTLCKIAKMASLLQVCRQFTYAVARLMDEGKGQMEASLVKLYACRATEWVAREALQIHGGMGYSEETAVSRYYADARVLSIFEGAEETLALKVIAKNLIENAE